MSKRVTRPRGSLAAPASAFDSSLFTSPLPCHDASCLFLADRGLVQTLLVELPNAVGTASLWARPALHQQEAALVQTRKQSHTQEDPSMGLPVAPGNSSLQEAALVQTREQSHTQEDPSMEIPVAPGTSSLPSKMIQDLRGGGKWKRVRIRCRETCMWKRLQLSQSAKSIPREVLVIPGAQPTLWLQRG